MIDVMNIYDCRKCGKRLGDQVERIEIINCEIDEVDSVLVCNTCHAMAEPRIHVTESGQRVHEMEMVSHERWLWATGYYDDLREVV